MLAIGVKHMPDVPLQVAGLLVRPDARKDQAVKMLLKRRIVLRRHCPEEVPALSGRRRQLLQLGHNHAARSISIRRAEAVKQILHLEAESFVIHTHGRQPRSSSISISSIRSILLKAVTYFGGARVQVGT